MSNIRAKKVQREYFFVIIPDAIKRGIKERAMENNSLEALVQEKNASIQTVFKEAHKVVVGQKNMLEGMLTAFLCDGHILLEGLPGLAKSLAVNTMAQIMNLDFQRIQFTPDLLPSDLIGSMVYNPRTSEFTPKKGPIFANIILADEINRSPAKVQSALLEAMAEKQVTLGEKTYPLPHPFIVLATQNPIEQEGTYALPEAQLDRFMWKIKVGYPEYQEEKVILERATSKEMPKIEKTISPETLNEAKAAVTNIYIDDKIKNYILNIVFASRFPEKYKLKELKQFIQIGASPRATINITNSAKTMAFFQNRSFVTPDDVKVVCYHVMCHRIILTYEAEANNLSPEDIIRKILDAVEVP